MIASSMGCTEKDDAKYTLEDGCPPLATLGVNVLYRLDQGLKPPLNGGF